MIRKSYLAAKLFVAYPHNAAKKDRVVHVPAGVGSPRARCGRPGLYLRVEPDFVEAVGARVCEECERRAS